MFINIYFKTVIYDSKKEKRKYEIEMSEEKLKICQKKSETVLDKIKKRSENN